jgi:hypothetical protein
VRNNVRSARTRIRRRCGLAALRAVLSADPSPRITNQQDSQAAEPSAAAGGAGVLVQGGGASGSQ